MIDLLYKLSSSTPLNFTTRHAILLDAPACTVMRSYTMQSKPAIMKIRTGFAPLHTTIYIQPEDARMVVKTNRAAMISESYQSMKKIDGLTIGMLDPISVGDIPGEATQN